MKLERSPGLHPALMFIAPSLDVVLALIFFIILSTSFLLQPGVEVSVPDSPFLLAPQRDPLVVSIAAPPISALYFENEQVTLEELRERLERRPSRNNTIIIKSDRLAPVEQLAGVMNITLGMGYPTVVATSEEK
ncbi:MAG: biopolymer transporter ExbD [Verrucomicrobia bacterium]|nr:biopolymer transporter ExbD [Verrucomicrobiota bacterium]